MKSFVFWDVALCGSCKNRRFGGTYQFHHNTVFLRSVLRLLVTANVSSSPILVALMMEAICSSETSVLTGATRILFSCTIAFRFYFLNRQADRNEDNIVTCCNVWPYEQPWISLEDFMDVKVTPPPQKKTWDGVWAITLLVAIPHSTQLQVNSDRLQAYVVSQPEDLNPNNNNFTYSLAVSIHYFENITSGQYSEIKQECITSNPRF
jgi:hypothetical protein